MAHFRFLFQLLQNVSSGSGLGSRKPSGLEKHLYAARHAASQQRDNLAAIAAHLLSASGALLKEEFPSTTSRGGDAARQKLPRGSREAVLVTLRSLTLTYR